MTHPECRQYLRNVVNRVRHRYPFSVDGWVLLPEHLHCVWTLPEGDADFSKRWSLIKAGFSKKVKALFHRKDWMNTSKTKHRESSIWQRRFWEHQIRDDGDYRNHIDYLHYNPVKHGLVKQVQDWPYSTIHRYVRLGIYTKNWGVEPLVEVGHEFGE